MCSYIRGPCGCDGHDSSEDKDFDDQEHDRLPKKVIVIPKLNDGTRDEIRNRIIFNLGRPWCTMHDHGCYGCHKFAGDEFIELKVRSNEEIIKKAIIVPVDWDTLIFCKECSIKYDIYETYKNYETILFDENQNKLYWGGHYVGMETCKKVYLGTISRFLCSCALGG